MDSSLYQDILGDEMFGSVESCVGDTENWIFQQDNASCHKSAATQQWFEDNDVNVIEFPAYSPDLNPIENLWWIVKCKLYHKGPFSTEEELFEEFGNQWYNIDADLCEKLIDSMPNRINAVIKAKGDATKW